LGVQISPGAPKEIKMTVNELIGKLQDLPDHQKNMEVRKVVRIYEDYDSHNEDYPISEVRIGYKGNYVEIK
jgi:hypothetical protein